ncbi:MAG: Zn-dependent oligopeptidase, partial [Rhodocyclaceae bacterium]
MKNIPATLTGISVLSCATIICAFLAPIAQAAGERPVLPLFTSEQITSGCASTIADLRQRVKALEQMPATDARDPKLLFARWDALQIAQEDFQGPADLLGNVAPDKAVRDAVEPCKVEFSKFSSDLFQSEKLYRMFKGVEVSDPVDRKLKRDIVWAFEDTGVSLPARKRARMKAILTKLEELSVEFSRNIRDNTQRLVFTADEVKGLRPDYLAKARRDDKGNYLLGFAYPEYIPFMENADDEAARKRYQFAFYNRGTPKNLAILKEATTLRKEMVGLFGLPSYAEYIIRRRMAGSPAAVDKFLAEVRVAVTASEKAEIEELRSFRADASKQPLAGT